MDMWDYKAIQCTGADLETVLYPVSPYRCRIAVSKRAKLWDE